MKTNTRPFYKDWQYWTGDVVIWIAVILFRSPQLTIMSWKFWLIAALVGIGIGMLYEERKQ